MEEDCSSEKILVLADALFFSLCYQYHQHDELFLRFSVRTHKIQVMCHLQSNWWEAFLTISTVPTWAVISCYSADWEHPRLEQWGKCSSQNTIPSTQVRRIYCLHTGQHKGDILVLSWALSPKLLDFKKKKKKDIQKCLLFMVSLKLFFLTPPPHPQHVSQLW